MVPIEVRATLLLQETNKILVKNGLDGETPWLMRHSSKDLPLAWFRPPNYVYVYRRVTDWASLREKLVDAMASCAAHRAYELNRRMLSNAVMINRVQALPLAAQGSVKWLQYREWFKELEK